MTSTLVYIEDHPSNTDLMRSIVNRRPDWTLSQASTGLDGLEMVYATTPTLVLLDLDLPDLDGIDVLRALKRDPRTADIPVSILSADVRQSQIKDLYDAGADSYLTKPLNVGEFLQFLDSHALADGCRQ